MTPRRRAIELLLSTCTVGAVFVLGSTRLNAQTGFQGAPTIVTGEVTITSAGGHDDIEISNTQIAVIDWRPFGGGPAPIDFLPATNSVRFVGDGFNPSGVYTVLNRIFPGEPGAIMLNGAISSQVAYTGQPTTGGSIWLYTPGGFIVGSTATFNVGGLVLSANNITLDANNGFDPNTVRFVGAAGSTSGISILKGAQINATNYVALIAPQIVQSGTIRSDGQIAYIAAETGTLTMPLGGGLFSIAIDAGGGTTVGGTAIAHDGSTGGPVNAGSTLNKRIYMVTVAKNNAVTMLLGGTIGYDLSAAAVGNTIVLSAGRDVVNGDAVLTGAPAGPAASIQLTNANLTTPLVASASGDITLLAQGGGTLSVLGAVLAVADGTATAQAGVNSTINISGNVTLQTASFGLTAGTAQVIADTGGGINIKGVLNVLADADGVRRGFIGSGSATGGTASVSANGGSITANSLLVSATGVARPGPIDAVVSTGGTATVTVANGAALNVGPLTIDASAGIGPGGTVANNPFGIGAAAVGGTASLTADNATYAPNATPLKISARALGGSGQTGGGAATGGTVLSQAINNGALTLPGLSIDVTGTGGASFGGAGGSGRGGGATVRAQGGAVMIADASGPLALTVDARGIGGTGTGGAVAAATGGTITLAGTGAALSAGTTSLSADGNALGAGGTVALTAANAGGSLVLGDTTLSANGGNGGRISLTNTSAAASPAMRFASLNASALGTVVAGGASFLLTATGNRIAATGDAAIATGGDQTYAASGGGGFDVGNTLTITAGGAVSLTHAANGGAVDTVNAGDVSATGQSITVAPGAIFNAARTMVLTAVNGIDASTLRAGISIDGSAGGAVTLGNVTVTAPAQANGGGGLDTSVGRIAFVAGANGGASYRAFNLNVTGGLSANALIDLTAGQDVRIGSAGSLTSANRIRLASGDDVLVLPGAVVVAGQAPLGGNPLNAGLDLTAGQLTLVVPPPAGNVAAIIANGSLSSNTSAMRLLGGAVVVTGPVTAGSLTVDIAGTATGSDGGQLSGNCQGRDICLDAVAVSGALTAGQGGTGTPGNVGIASGTVGGALLVNAANGIRLGRAGVAASLTAGGPTRLVSGGTIDLLGTLAFTSTGALGLRAGGGITGATSTIRGNGDVALTGGSLNLTSLTAGGLFTGADANGFAAGLPGVTGAATLGTLSVNGGDINFTAPGGITFGQVFVSEGRLVRFDAGASALRVTSIIGGPLGVAGAITLNGGSVTADRLQARNAVTLTATGAVAVTTDVSAASVAAQGSSVVLNAIGPLTITSIVATNGDATATSGGALTVAAGQASGAINLTSQGTATLSGPIAAGTAINATGQTIAANGTLRAPLIAFRSAAMQIGAAAQIGAIGTTQTVGFTNTGVGASFVGGAGGAGYSLTNAGLGRVQSRDITIVLPGDVTVGDLALNGALNLGGTLSLTTLGTVTVNGAVGLTNAAAANAITFNAGPAIRVVTPTGSISMRSAAGAPTGTLTLNAATVAVASQTALTDIAAAADVVTRNARLAINDGPVNDQGYLVAGTMRFAVSAGLYIQNSGATSPMLTARRGFTVGDGGMTISTLGGQAVGIVINGRQLLADGTIIAGAPLIPRITLNGGPAGAALFDTQSTVNGCRIVLGVCPNDNSTPKTLVGIRDTIGVVNGDVPPGLSPPAAAAAVNGVIPPIIIPAIGVEGLDPYSVEPPIDEPVIGVGNEDNWSDGKQP